MKSKVTDAAQSDSFVGEDWKRIVFDNVELCEAIENDDIAGLVRRVLQPVYGTMLVFEPLVAYVSISVRKAVATACFKAISKGHALCILHNHSQCEREEKVSKQRAEYADTMPKYWVGEGHMIEDWREKA